MMTDAGLRIGANCATMTTITAKQSHKLQAIQSLRAIAAGLIVLYHIGGQEKLYAQSANPILHNFEGAYGVDIFFIISGFIMVYVTDSQPAGWQTSRTFFLKRLIRIVPVYWFYTSVMVILLLVWPQLFRDTQFEIGHVLKSYFFIPNQQLPILALGWTLNYEMYFYLVFAIFLVFPRQYRIVGLSVWFGGTVLAGQTITFASPIWWRLTDPIVLEFLLGAYLGLWVLQGRLLQSWVAVGFFIGGIGLIWLSVSMEWQAHRLVIWGLPSLLIVAAYLSLEQQGWSFGNLLPTVGDSSYSLYLSHAFVVIAVARGVALLNLSGLWFSLALLMIGFGLSVFVGLISYHLIERPSWRYLQGRMKPIEAKQMAFT